MKSVAKRRYKGERTRNCWYEPFTKRIDVEEAVRFTLSQSVATVASSSDLEIAKMTIDVALDFTPMTLEEQVELLKKAESVKPLFS